METIEETLSSVVVLNHEPEFTENDTENFSAKYFILCEENLDSEFEGNIFEKDICGMSVLSWVKRACAADPVILKVKPSVDVLRLVKNYMGEEDFSVVLYANTPLLNKQHLLDLLGFVSRRHMNACKLKKGYVFRNDYIQNVDEIYSIDTYDFASNDFFEINTLADFEKAKSLLVSKVFDYHKRNGVYFENEKTSMIDASVEVGYGTKFASGVTVIENSKLDLGVVVQENALIKNSKICENVCVGEGAIIIDSIIKSGAKVAAGAFVKGSVVGEEVDLKEKTVVIGSAIKEGAVVCECVKLVKAKVGKFAEIGALSNLCGKTVPVKVEEHTTLPAGSNVIEKVSSFADDGEE